MTEELKAPFAPGGVVQEEAQQDDTTRTLKVITKTINEKAARVHGEFKKELGQLLMRYYGSQWLGQYVGNGPKTDGVSWEIMKKVDELQKQSIEELTSIEEDKFQDVLTNLGAYLGGAR